MQSGYQGSTHKQSKAANLLVERVANKANDLSLQRRLKNREGVLSAKAIRDLRCTGRQTMALSALPTFNKKMAAVVRGKVPVESDEQDTLPSPAFATPNVVIDDDEDQENDADATIDD